MIYIDEQILHFIKEKKETTVSKKSTPLFKICVEKVIGRERLPLTELFQQLKEKCQQKYGFSQPFKRTINHYFAKTGMLTILYHEIDNKCMIENNIEVFGNHYTDFSLFYSYSQEVQVNCAMNGQLKKTVVQEVYEYKDTGFTYVFTTGESPLVEIVFDIQKLTPQLLQDSLSLLDFKSNITIGHSNIIRRKIKIFEEIFQPVNVSTEMVDYQVTSSGGTQQLVYTFNGEMYSVKNEINYIGKSTNLFECVLNTQFTDKYYTFDCYMYKGENVSTKVLSERLRLAAEISSFEMKEFSADLPNATQKILKQKKDLLYLPENPSLPILRWKFEKVYYLRAIYNGEMSIKVNGLFETFFFYKMCIRTQKDTYGKTPFLEYKSRTKLTNDVYEFNSDFNLVRPVDEKPSFEENTIDSKQLLILLNPKYKSIEQYEKIRNDMLVKYCENKIVFAVDQTIFKDINCTFGNNADVVFFNSEKDVDNLKEGGRLIGLVEKIDFNLLVQNLKKIGIDLEETELVKIDETYRKFVFKKHTLTNDIFLLCDKVDIYDLMTKTTDQKCIAMFNTYLKKGKFELVTKPSYDMLKEFYHMKKYVNPLKSPNLLKAYCLFEKSYVREKVDAVPLKKYKTDFKLLRQQLLDTLDLFCKHKIDYGSLNLENGLMVSVEPDGYVRLVFADYSNLQINPNVYKDKYDVIPILEYLS